MYPLVARKAVVGMDMASRHDRRHAAGLLLVALTAPALAGFQALETLLAPSAALWPRWQEHDPASTADVDHAAWDGLLASYRRIGDDGIARFAYGAVGAADRAALQGHVERLAATRVTGLGRDAQRAYWINLYNALTVRVVLEHYPVETIRDIDISPGWFSDGPWDAPLVEIEGQPVTLNDIEHRILRPIWRDPRIHYAINCAALGCPNLPAEAVTPGNAEAILAAAARAYVNHPRGARLDGDRLTVSSIYIWFVEDFGGSDAGVIAHLRRHAEPGLAAALETVDRITDHGYDWRLNDASLKPGAP